MRKKMNIYYLELSLFIDAFIVLVKFILKFY